MSHVNRKNQIHFQDDDDETPHNNDTEGDKESLSSTTTNTTVSWLLHSAWSVPKSVGGYIWDTIKGKGGDSLSLRSNNSYRHSNSSSPSLSPASLPSLPSSDLNQNGKGSSNSSGNVNGHGSDNNNNSNAKNEKIIPSPKESKSKNKIPSSNNTCYLDSQDFGIKLIERHAKDPNDHLVTTTIISKLHTTLSSKWRLANTWKLLYSTTEYGFSLGTLYSQSRSHYSSASHQYHYSPFGGALSLSSSMASDGDQGKMASGGSSNIITTYSPQLVCIKDENDNLFGLMASEALRPHSGPYGSIDCFLWKLEPKTNRIIKYAGTGKNNCYLLSERDFVASGCSNGKFGLWLDEELLNGTSSSVSTFDNEPLSSAGESFQCISLELWGLEIQ